MFCAITGSAAVANNNTSKRAGLNVIIES